MTLFFEEFQVGQELEGRSRTVTEADIINFSGISGDFYPLHTDEEFAKKTIYGRRIAHGAFTLAATTGAMTSLNVFSENSIIALVGVDKMKFIKPVYIGDTITPRFRVAEKRDHRRGGIITLSVEVSNQRREVVMSCNLGLLLKRRLGTG